MTRQERALLLALAQEVILQLRAKVSEIETLHPRESSIAVATFQDRLRRIEDMTAAVQKDGASLEG
ncbi:MAG TPA: hypothetical protein PK090_04020 [Smithellaceae bacterium]|nr:hypothetical protein [Smithellaceae bacterium]